VEDENTQLATHSILHSTNRLEEELGEAEGGICQELSHDEVHLAGKLVDHVQVRLVAAVDHERERAEGGERRE